MVAAIVQRTAIDERQTYSCCLAEFVKGQTIGEHLLQIQETPGSNCTCIAGSPYQKEDSLYDEDDYDGEDAAGQLQKMSMLSLRDFI